MIKVTVKPFLHIYDALGKQKKIDVLLNNESTILNLLITLRKSYNLPDEIHIGKFVLKLFDGNEIRDLMILKGGRNIKSLEGLETKLEDGDAIALFPPAAGG